MRILQICHSYYPPFLDCARQYAALADGTPYKMLTVYLTGEPNDAVAKKSHSDEVIFLGFKSKEVGGLKLKAIAKIKEIAKREQFAFCIAHRVKPTYLALVATDLKVISVHHSFHHYERWIRRQVINYYKHRVFMLGVSDSVRDSLRAQLQKWDSSQIETLYNRIDVGTTTADMCSKHDARKALNLPENAWVIGNVGRLHPEKDQATLIKGFHQALPSLPNNSLLLIVGDGRLRAELEALVDQLDLTDRVVFAGNVQDAKRYFKAFDVFALTSILEGFGMVLLEAMAAELPIVCSDCGGQAEVVRGVGRLFEFKNVNALSHALVESIHLNKHQKEQVMKRLNEVFSDKAVRERFWGLSKVKNILSE